MNPEPRRLVKVMPADVEETARVFDLLLGDNLAGRKDYIAENGYKYMDMIVVSCGAAPFCAVPRWVKRPLMPPAAHFLPTAAKSVQKTPLKPAV